MPNVLGLVSRQPSARGAGEAPGGAGPSRSGTPLSQRTNSLRGEREGSRRGQASPMPQQPEEKYIVYLRFPFERNGFVDPPQVDWDATKERYLWRYLSRSNRNTDLDWNALATHLQVSRAFLLQQAAWLYERELSQIQAQMRKVGGPALNVNLSFPTPPSPRPQSPAVMGGVPMTRTGTAGTVDPRVHSSLSFRSNPITTPRATPGLPPTPTTSRPSAQPMSRTGSARTATQISTAHRLSNQITAEDSPIPSLAQRPSSSEVSEEDGEEVMESSTTGSSDDGDDDDDGDDMDQPLGRFPGFLKKNHGLSSDEDDADQEPAFLPFAVSEKTPGASEGGMTNTVTLPKRRPRLGKGREMSGGLVSSVEGAMKRKGPGVTMGGSRNDSLDASSPSMGSSFSDLSDTSVTQSAMEEAYLSTIQAGGMGSRMSILGQAVKSRYFPT